MTPWISYLDRTQWAWTIVPGGIGWTSTFSCVLASGLSSKVDTRLRHITGAWVLDVSWRNEVLFLQTILFTLCHLPGLSLQVASLSTWTAFISFRGVSREKKYESRNFQDSWELGSEIAQYNSGTFYWSKQTKKKKKTQPCLQEWEIGLHLLTEEEIMLYGKWARGIRGHLCGKIMPYKDLSCTTVRKKSVFLFEVGG